MTTAIEKDRPDAKGVKASKRSRPRVRGRGWPVALAGIGAVIALAVAAYVWASQNEEVPPRQVLVAAVSMEAGHVIAAADLREVAVETEGLELLGADQAGAIIGQTVALPVAKGTPLSANLLGPASTPTPGRAVTSLSFPDGAYPSGLEAGQSVVLVAGSNGESATADPATVWQMAAIVRAVSAFEGGALVALEFNAADRTGLASARGTDPFLVAMIADAPTTEEGE